MSFRIVFVGPPGSGKGTQASLLNERYGIVKVSTGDLLRAEIERGSELGVMVEGIISRGEFVSDDIVLELIKGEIDRTTESRGVLFDGYPRNVAQARCLSGLLHDRGIPLTHVFEFVVSDDVLIERLLSRGVLAGRSDDSLDVARNRLAIYAANLTGLQDFYSGSESGHDLVYEKIDALGSVEEVFNRIRVFL
jgi:adenylate kinase